MCTPASIQYIMHAKGESQAGNWICIPFQSHFVPPQTSAQSKNIPECVLMSFVNYTPLFGCYLATCTHTCLQPLPSVATASHTHTHTHTLRQERTFRRGAGEAWALHLRATRGNWRRRRDSFGMSCSNSAHAIRAQFGSIF